MTLFRVTLADAAMPPLIEPTALALIAVFVFFYPTGDHRRDRAHHAEKQEAQNACRRAAHPQYAVWYARGRAAESGSNGSKRTKRTAEIVTPIGDRSYHNRI